MKTIKQTHVIHVSPKRVFEALTNPKDIETWSGSGAKFETKEGGKYSMWDNWVKGEVLEIDPPEKLAQTWEPSDWEPQKEQSVATFTLHEKGGGTEIEFEHTNVPEEHYKSTSEGWRDYYLGAIKEYLEKGS